MISRTPCESCEKIPREIRTSGIRWYEMQKHAREITPQNRQAVRAYQEFAATNQFPNDPIVRWYSGIILDEEKHHERLQRDAMKFPQSLFIEVIEALIRFRH